jgi:carbon-monoxide dehydrogenase medium subunit/xanthine dehydrogenase FAD-binding subunit
MIPNINFYAPKTLQELFSLFDEFNENYSLLAGGTDVVTGFQQNSARFISVKNLIDLNEIKEIKGIQKLDDKIILKAGTTFSDVIKNETIKEYFPLLVKSSQGVGSVQIRNRATLVGNFVNNAPCADSVPALLVYNAVIEIQSRGSKSEIPLQEFLIKPYRTQLKPGEVVTAIKLPILQDKYEGDFYKLGRRRALSISRISLAMLIRVERNIIKDFRIASGAVSPIGKRFYKLEETVLNKQISSGLIKKFSSELGKEILEITGLRWSTHYKLPVVQQVCCQMFYNLCGLKTDE